MTNTPAAAALARRRPPLRNAWQRALVAVSAVGITAATALGVAALPAVAAPINTHGLVIVSGSADVPDSLADAYAAAATVAQSAPDDFGYPMIDGNVVDLPTVSAAAVALQNSAPDLVKAKLNGYAQKSTKKADDPNPVNVPNLGNSLDKVKLTHPSKGKSATQLQDVNNKVFDIGQLPAFAAAAVTESGIDASGHVILTVGRLTEPLAATIVAHFGADDIRIVIDPSLTSSAATRAGAPARGWLATDCRDTPD